MRSDDVFVIAEPDALRVSTLEALFSNIRYGPRSLLADSKTEAQKEQLSTFCREIETELLSRDPGLVFLGFADPVVACLARMRRSGSLQGTKLVLWTRRTLRASGSMVTQHLCVDDARELDVIAGCTRTNPLREDLAPKYRFVPFEPGRTSIEWATASGGGYIFSGGGHGRDFTTLAAACHDLDREVRIYTWLREPFDPSFQWPLSCRFHEIDELMCTPGDPDAARSLASWLSLMASSLFVVVPLKKSGETRGLTVVLQALRLEKPVVVSWTPGIETYVEDGVSGIIVPPESPIELRAAIKRLADQDTLRARLSRGAALSAKMFDLDGIRNAVTSILSSLGFGHSLGDTF